MVAVASQDIKVNAQLILNAELSQERSVALINAGIRDICVEYYTACKEVSKTIIATEDEQTLEFVDDTETLVKFKYLKTSDGMKARAFEQKGDFIKIYYAGTYTIVYYVMAEKITKLTNAVTIPIEYHNALEYYVAYKERSRMFGANDYIAKEFRKIYIDAMGQGHTNMLRKGGFKQLRRWT